MGGILFAGFGFGAGGGAAVWHLGPCEQPLRGRRGYVDHAARTAGRALEKRMSFNCVEM